MLNSILAGITSSQQPAPAARQPANKPDEAGGANTAPKQQAPASPTSQAEPPRPAQPAAEPAPKARAEQAPPPPTRPTPAPSESILSASTALVPVETAAPAEASTAADPLADKRAALAKITDTAQNWGQGSTVLDAAVAFSSKSAEESGAAPEAKETLPATTGRNTEESARTIAAEQGYSASKSLYEGAAPQGETSKAA